MNAPIDLPRRALAHDALDGVTLGAFLGRHGFGDALVRHYVLPMGGAIWSAPTINTRFALRMRSTAS